MFPGEGALPVDDFVDVVLGTGYDGMWDVEMLSDDFRAMDPVEAVRRAHDTASAVLARHAHQQP